MIRFLAFFLAVLLAGGCAGRPQPRPETPSNPDALMPPPESPVSPDRVGVPVLPSGVESGPSAVFARFLEAVESGQAGHVWSGLSSATRSQAGGDPARGLALARGRFAGWHSYRIVVDETVGPDLAVVTVAGGPPDRAAAAALVREEQAWRVAVPSGPPLPPPVEDGRTAVAAAGVRAVWLDGGAVPVSPEGLANLPTPLPPGPHVLTLLLKDGIKPPAAHAWAIRGR